MILLDTHAWVFWIGQPGRLSRKARAAIDSASQEGGGVCISAISAWEVAMLVSRGRLELTLQVEEWIRRCERLQAVRFVPVDSAIAVASVLLPGSLHPDPADRIVAATARELGCPVVTADRRLRSYPHVKTIW
jgi:PIN domain nuclease of toxin-antitoxin system